MSIEKIKFVFKVLVISALAATLQIANANIWPSTSPMELIKFSCPTGLEQYQELNQLKKSLWLNQ
jgi:hypothetical protein